MLAVVAFVAFWVIVALGLVMVAGRAGGARPSRGVTRAASQSALTLFVVTAAVFGIALPIVLLIGNHTNASAQVGGIKLTSGEKAGRELFGEHCGVCHTLAAANAVGKVGPNLDLLRPQASIVLHTIANGCLPNPGSANTQEACLGYGVMPSDVVQGRQAAEVANFVAVVTGAGGGTVATNGGPSAAPSTSTSSSSSSSSTTTSTTSAPSSTAGQKLAVAAAKGGALKYNVSTLSAKAGKVTFAFTNDSPLPHNLTIQRGTNGRILGATPTFAGGTKTLTLTLPAGTYKFFCSVPGHRQAGMLGTLTVR
jgi:plastocyanin